MARPCIGIVGAGQIGNSAAIVAILQRLGDVILYDVVEGMPQGKALDLSQMATALSIDLQVTGSNDLTDLKCCDVLIITAGVPRKPGMSRDDLLAVNKNISTKVAEGVKANGTQPLCIITTNPLDVMVMVFQEASGLPTNKVVGMAGILDASRFKYFLSRRLNVSANDIRAQLMGGHGDLMVPVTSQTSINGIPLSQYIGEGKDKLSQLELDSICQRTRVGGGEIVALLKTGSAFNAPAAACLEMAKSYLYDEKRTLPCCCHLNGEYGQKGIYGGVTCVIGKDGVERVVEVELTEDEKKQFEASMTAVKELREVCAKL